MRAILPLVMVFATIVSGCVGMGAYFAYAALRADHRVILEDRLALATDRVAGTARLSLSLGISLSEQATLVPLLRREARLEPLARAVDVLDADGRIIFSNDPRRVGGRPQTADGVPVASPIGNDIGDQLGQVVLYYDPAPVAATVDALWTELMPLAIATVSGAGIVTLILGMLAAGRLRRDAARAADLATWPAAARRRAVEAEAALDGIAHRLGG